MMEILNTGQPIALRGKSGEQYLGIIYDKESDSTVSGRGIVCLTKSNFIDHEWSHSINSIYNTDDVKIAVEDFKNRDDISHVIIIPLNPLDLGKNDKVDDLIRAYIHK